jgi:hypothetical protein
MSESVTRHVPLGAFVPQGSFRSGSVAFCGDSARFRQVGADDEFWRIRFARDDTDDFEVCQACSTESGADLPFGPIDRNESGLLSRLKSTTGPSSLD